MIGKLGLPFPLLSDPRGDLIKHLGLWNEQEGVSEPAIVVLDKSSTVQYLYSGGKDFSARPPQEKLLEILDKVDTGGVPPRGEPEVVFSTDEAEEETMRPNRPAITFEALKSYYRGTYFATVAMQKKLEPLGRKGKAAREQVDAYQDLVNEYRVAIRETE